MSTQKNLSSLARSGDPQALAELINKGLKSRNIKVAIVSRENRLKIMAESSEIPNKDDLTSWIEAGLYKLNSPHFHSAVLYARVSGASQISWKSELTLSQEAKIESPLPTPSRKSRKTKATKPNANKKGSNTLYTFGRSFFLRIRNLPVWQSAILSFIIDFFRAFFIDSNYSLSFVCTGISVALLTINKELFESLKQSKLLACTFLILFFVFTPQDTGVLPIILWGCPLYVLFEPSQRYRRSIQERYEKEEQAYREIYEKQERLREEERQAPLRLRESIESELIESTRKSITLEALPDVLVCVRELQKIEIRVEMGVSYRNFPSIIAPAKLAVKQLKLMRSSAISGALERILLYYELSFYCFQSRVKREFFPTDTTKLIWSYFPELEGKLGTSNLDVMVSTIWSHNSHLLEKFFLEVIVSQKENFKLQSAVSNPEVERGQNFSTVLDTLNTVANVTDLLVSVGEYASISEDLEEISNNLADLSDSVDLDFESIDFDTDFDF